MALRVIPITIGLSGQAPIGWAVCRSYEFSGDAPRFSHRAAAEAYRDAQPDKDTIVPNPRPARPDAFITLDAEFPWALLHPRDLPGL